MEPLEIEKMLPNVSYRLDGSLLLQGLFPLSWGPRHVKPAEAWRAKCVRTQPT
jgi:hypothetical protein